MQPSLKVTPVAEAADNTPVVAEELALPPVVAEEAEDMLPVAAVAVDTLAAVVAADMPVVAAAVVVVTANPNDSRTNKRRSLNSFAACFLSQPTLKPPQF